ncbi:phage terminase large subunit family protein, partial [Escherichia coli]|uniref:phage terminase large subunit family protein n=1 Tax=Escherichia coli TaxID=562 RepID=UPI0028DD9E1D
APITWARIRWPERQRDAAYLVCDACGGVHQEHEKPRMMSAGEYLHVTQAPVHLLAIALPCCFACSPVSSLACRTPASVPLALCP